MDTVPAQITPQSALRILETIDQRGESWCFVGHAKDPGELTLFVDGNEADLTVFIRPDGTWGAAVTYKLGD
jgi:hypothetical protein